MEPYDLLNAIASIIPLADKTDLSGLTQILTKLETLAAETSLPPAMLTVANRAIELTNNIIMGETDFDTGCKKLGDCVAKMRKGIDPASPPATQTNDGPKEPPPKKELPDDLKDLLVKFAGSQQGVLEDFEAYVLEFEKGVPEAKSALKRVLHTWKGEFGVLDLPDYSKLIHEVEDKFENNELTAEHLFKLKDFLQTTFEKALRGVVPQLSPDEKTALLPDCKAPAPEPAKPEITVSQAPAASPSAVSAQQTEASAAASQSALNADPSLLADFVHESRDHIHTAETFLLELETAPANGESINSVFRAWHTIKGVAGFLGLREIATLAHAMENLMDLARKGELVLNAEYIDVLLEGNDCLKEFIDVVENGISGAAFRVPEAFDSIIKKLSSPGAISQSAPVSAEPVKKVGEILVENGVAAQQDVENALQLQREGDGRKLGEILIADKNIPARVVGGALAAQTASRQSAAIEETIRVPVNRIDQLVDSIGEAVIAQSMINADASIKKIADQTLHTKIEHSEMIMRQIQELAMSLRMVSIKSTFQKMARLVRDLSKKSCKDVNFITEGEDTELDKSVVEKIGDPLIHMIRNSVDHGIEPAEDRKKTGKPLSATVILRAYHKAGNIYIEVVDDGKGLDKDAIFSKALSKGLCKNTDNLSEQEIFAFIFLPGFSTAKIITDVSGRGVGMDVVRRNIEALRGSVEIQSQQGVGTTFTIRLPLTLAIVDGMIVRSKGDSYIIPTLSIVESIRPTAQQRMSVLKRGEMINVRGELIPLVNLARIFDKTNGHYGATEGVVMIVEDMIGKKIGLEIDEIMGQQQVVIKNLGVGIGDVPGISGGAIMSDGHVSLIIDIGGIAKMMDG